MLKQKIDNLQDEVEEYRQLYEQEADEHAETKAKLEDAQSNLDKVTHWLNDIEKMLRSV